MVFTIYFFLKVVFELKEIMTAMEYQRSLLVEQGIEQGKLQMALKIKKEFGIEKAIQLSGLSKEELME